MRSSERIVAAVAVFACVASLALSFGAVQSKPFEHGWLGRNGARYAIAARNLQRLPLATTRAAPCMASGALDEEGALPYVRHPPGFPWLIAASFAVFGESERSARLVPAAFTVGCAVLVFSLGCAAAGSLAGALSAALFCLLPMTLLYGAHVDMQSSVTTFFVLLSVVFLQRVRHSEGRRGNVGLAVSLVAAMLCDWPGWFAAAAAGGTLALDRRSLRPLISWWGLGVGVFLLFLAWVSLQPDTSLGSLRDALGERSTGISQLFDRDDAGTHLKKALRRADELFPTWFLGPGILLALFLRRSPAGRRGGTGAAPLFAVGLLHVSMFPAGALQHDYWLYLLAAPLALAIGPAVTILVARPTDESWRRALAAFVAVAALSAGVWSGQHWLASRLERERAPRHRLLAQAVADNTRFEDRIFTNALYNELGGQRLSHPEFSYYSDRKVRGGVSTVAEWEEVLDTAVPTHFLVVPVLGVIDVELVRLLEGSMQGEEIMRGVMLYRR